MIGDRIKTLREQMGYGLTEFADMVGVKKQTLYKYEKNIVTNIPLSTIERIAHNLSITPAELVGWTSNGLSNVEKHYIDSFRSLNKEGQEKADEFVDMLSASGKYKKHNKHDMVQDA